VGSAAKFSDTHPAEIGWVSFFPDSHPFIKIRREQIKIPALGLSKSVTEESKHEH
jgi:hypothetical protein